MGPLALGGAVGSVMLVLLKAVAWWVYLIPDAVRSFWGNRLGGLLRRLGLRSKVVHQNLELAYAGDPRRREALFAEAYRHLGNLVLEVLMLLGPMRRYVLRKVDLIGSEHWCEAKKLGKGVIFLANHVGNWEVMAAGGALHGGIDILLVTKHLKPEWLHRAIERGRSRCGVQATYEPRTLKDVLGWLKRNRTVGIVLDQYAGPPVGVRVPVFGVPVGTSSAIATLARRTGAPVLPVVNYRTPEGRWRIEIRPPIGWEADDDGARELARNTARFASEMEKDILAHPEQWLWIHRRFKGDLSPLRSEEWTEGRART